MADDDLAPFLDAVLAVASDLDLDGVLDRIVRAGRELVGARYAALGVLDDSGTGLARFLHVGLDEETARAIGPLPTGHGVLGELIRHPHPLMLEELSTHPSSVGFPPNHPPMTTFLGVPVVVAGEVFGNLYLTDKPGGFDDADERLVVALAAAAGVAIRNARDAATLEEWAVRVDRERIARDLHDTVIQRLFGAGLQLDGLGRRVQDEGVAATVEAVIGELDAAIADLRETITAMHTPRSARVEDRLHAVVDALRPANAGLTPLQVSGRLHDLPAALIGDLVAALREGITNATRHAGAGRIEARVVRSSERIELTVTDDGVGPAATPTESARPGAGLGLGNLMTRAEARGGGSRLTVREDGTGAALHWWVPLDP